MGLVVPAAGAFGGAGVGAAGAVSRVFFGVAVAVFDLGAGWRPDRFAGVGSMIDDVAGVGAFAGVDDRVQLGDCQAPVEDEPKMATSSTMP